MKWTGLLAISTQSTTEKPETAKIMKWIDEDIELVACGSATSLMPSYPEWDRIVLEHTYEQVDYLSLHRYYENHGNDRDFASLWTWTAS